MDSNGQRWVSGRGVAREAAFSRSPVSDVGILRSPIEDYLTSCNIPVSHIPF
ncbi:hypothetical protein ACS0TY_004021 [Phlomoides rotata]